jgi:hypothetical protein
MDKEPESPDSASKTIMDFRATVGAVGDVFKTLATFTVCLIQDSPKLVSHGLGFYSDKESSPPQHQGSLTRNPSFPSFSYAPPSIINKD